MREGVRYLVAGAATNVVVLAIYFGLSLGAGLRPVVALPAASLVGVAVGYVVHSLYTFRSGNLERPALVKYAATYAWSALFQWAFLMLFHDVFGFHHALVVLMGVGWATAMSFLLQRNWVFRARG